MKPEPATTILVCGYELTIDESDYSLVANTSLHINKGVKSSVQFENSRWVDGKCKMVRLENIIYGNQPDLKVEFVDGNCLNFQKSNLRRIRPKLY